MDDTKELKPCPNCGSKDIIHLPTIINCQNCHLAVSNSGYLEKPESIWNALPRRGDNNLANEIYATVQNDRINRLEKEADWLAEYLADADQCVGCDCPAQPPKYPCKDCWREAARKAVEAQCKS